MYKLILINIIFLLFIVNSFSQKIEITPFQKVYNNQGSQRLIDIIELDTSLVMLGSSALNGSSKMQILRVSKEDGKIFSSKFVVNTEDKWNPYQLFKDSNEDFWILCENEFIDHSYTHLIKIDANGSVVLDISIGTDSTYQRMNFIDEYNGVFYMTGTFSSPDMSYGNDFWVVKMSKGGKIIWDKHFGIDSINEVATSLQIVNDRVYIFGDKNKPDYSYNPYVITIDTLGNFISETQLDWPFNGGVKSSCISETNIYVTGESSTATSTWFDIYLDKFDLNGNRVWRKLIQGSNKSEAGFDIKHFQGKLFLTGYAYNSNIDNTDMHCTILDTSGNILKQKLYNLGDIDIGYQIIPTNYGGYYIAGNGSNLGDNEYLLVYDTTSILKNTSNLQVSKPSRINIYPNPGKIPQIHLLQNQNYSNLIVLDLQGKIVLDQNITNKKTIPIKLNEKGLYFAIISNNSSVERKKIIIH